MVAVTLIAVGAFFVVRGVIGRPVDDVGPDSRDWVSAFAILSGFERSNNSQAFRGGDLTAIMGDLVRVAEAELPAEEAAA